MISEQRTPQAWVASSWINAWALRAALAREGVTLQATAPALMLAQSPGRPAAGDWLFFTEENSLARALAAPAGLQFLPRHFPSGLLDDKPAFEARCRALGLPVLPAVDEPDAVAAIGFPCILKARHSWRDGRRLPRGEVCRHAGDLQAARQRLAAAQLPEQWYYLQAWRADCRNFSVCGFHDAAQPQRNLLAVTVRVLAAETGVPSCAALVATVDDPAGLLALTRRLLVDLDYTGPFELEFMVAADGTAFVLELNPRLWLQHGLFVACGNGLIRRCLGRDDSRDHAAAATQVPRDALWVDRYWLLRQLLRGHWVSVWRCLVPLRGGRRLLLQPATTAVLLALWRRLWRQLRAARPESAP